MYLGSPLKIADLADSPLTNLLYGISANNGNPAGTNNLCSQSIRLQESPPWSAIPGSQTTERLLSGKWHALGGSPCRLHWRTRPAESAHSNDHRLAGRFEPVL